MILLNTYNTINWSKYRTKNQVKLESTFTAKRFFYSGSIFFTSNDISYFPHKDYRKTYYD